MNRAVVIGIGILVFGNVFSALYDVSVKWVSEDVNAATFLLIRQLTAVLMIMPLWLREGAPWSSHTKLHLFRAHVGTSGALLLIMGLMSLPLATVSSLFYSAPLMIMLMGYLFLKEKMSGAQSVAGVLGFIGILIILRPSEMNVFGIAVLAGALTFAINQLVLKKLPSTESPTVTLMLYNLFSVPIVMLFTIVQGFSGLSWEVIGLAVVSNAFLLAYQWLSVLAYRKAKASEVAIAEYTGLIFCVFFGWLWFDEWLDGLSWLGAGFIVLPSLLLPWISVGVKRRQRAAAVAQGYNG
ncbi:DMT family transporter [uncultured Shewanella sp.]|uniref:DMT family transporter n=1 Tax=Shewanella atlantica TaxID=271099 RepID=UPI002604B145|nr:DMT family transporter [uncultured Shewanella sp.]